MNNEKISTNQIPASWYIAKIVFQILVGASSDSQFDEQYRMVLACSSEHAFEKAKKIGQQEEGVFLNVKQENVHWKFIDVSAVHLIDLSTDGAQVYSETVETEDPSSYIGIQHQRAKAWQETEQFAYQKNLSC